jgi:phage N-6-adenine-methyltransferase
MSNQNMRTPKWLFDLLNELYGPFTLDAAASPHNALCDNFYTEKDNGLIINWSYATFCNPPFRNFKDWIAHAWVEWNLYDKSSCLIGPTGCSQKWFHKYAKQGQILVPDKRISFDTPEGKPTGVSECHNGLSNKDCKEACKCVNGADRDTMFYLFGYGRNPDIEFDIRTLNVRCHL